MAAARGRVYTVDIGYGRHHYVAISNNTRNHKLRSFLAARLTTQSKPNLASIVELSPADTPLTGRVLCDNIIELGDDEVLADYGVLTPATIRRVDDGILAALGMDHLYHRAR
jgi:mRNA interferase MazF